MSSEQGKGRMSTVLKVESKTGEFWHLDELALEGALGDDDDDDDDRRCVVVVIVPKSLNFS